MVGPDRTMLSVTKACAYIKVTEGIMRGWISRGDLTKGKIISVNKRSNQRSIVGVYVDELDKIIPKEDTFDPPDNLEGGYGKLLRSIECLYEGAVILGTNKLLKWEMARNMMRPKSDYT